MPGLEGVGSIFMRAPQLMLCKPTTNDRWDRRAVQLAHHAYKHGDCNVSEVGSLPAPMLPARFFLSKLGAGIV